MCSAQDFKCPTLILEYMTHRFAIADARKKKAELKLVKMAGLLAQLMKVQ